MSFFINIFNLFHTFHRSIMLILTMMPLYNNTITDSHSSYHIKYCFKTNIPEELQTLNNNRKTSIEKCHNDYAVKINIWFIIRFV